MAGRKMYHSGVLAALGKAARAPSWISESMRMGSIPTPSTGGLFPHTPFSPYHLVCFPRSVRTSEDFPIPPPPARRGLPGEARTPSLRLGLPSSVGRNSLSVDSGRPAQPRQRRPRRAISSPRDLSSAQHRLGTGQRGQSAGTSPRFSPSAFPGSPPRAARRAAVRAVRARGRCPGRRGLAPTLPGPGRPALRPGAGRRSGHDVLTHRELHGRLRPAAGHQAAGCDPVRRDSSRRAPPLVAPGPPAEGRSRGGAGSAGGGDLAPPWEAGLLGASGRKPPGTRLLPCGPRPGTRSLWGVECDCPAL